MRTLIVTGGTTEDAFLTEWMQKNPVDRMIASDSGLDFFYRTGLTPDLILGDFDSVNQKALERFRDEKKIPTRAFKPEKDETDTELAIRVALEEEPDEVVLFGATGSRLDHVLGNIGLLTMGLKKGVPCSIMDAHNRIRLMGAGTGNAEIQYSKVENLRVENSKTGTFRIEISKADQFGKYISLIPLTTEVKGVTLTGFKYPLKDAVLTSDNSLGISNELEDETGIIEMTEGILILIESKD